MWPDGGHRGSSWAKIVARILAQRPLTWDNPREMSTVTGVPSLAPAVPPTPAVTSSTLLLLRSRAAVSPLLAAAVISQLLDLVTYRPEIELNPLVRPETAVGLKVALLVLVAGSVLGLTGTRFAGYGYLVMAAAVAAGLVGALSNVVAVL